MVCELGSRPAEALKKTEDNRGKVIPCHIVRF